MDNRKAFYRNWIDAWNGEERDLATIFHDDVTVYQLPETRRGLDAVTAMIGQGRAPFSQVKFDIVIDPIVEGDMLAARWEMNAVYTGAIPNVSAAPGTSVTFGGMDIWRFENGKVREYWVSSDGLWLMEQLNP